MATFNEKMAQIGSGEYPETVMGGSLLNPNNLNKPIMEQQPAPATNYKTSNYNDFSYLTSKNIPSAFPTKIENPVVKPAIITSTPAKEDIVKNTTYLSQMEDNIKNTDTSQPITNTSQGNTSLSSMINQTNELLKSGKITGDQARALTERIGQLNDKELELTAKSKQQEQAGDFYNLKGTTDELKTAKKEKEDAIASLYKEVSPLRNEYIKTLVPNDAELKLNEDLTTLKQNLADYDVATQEAIFGMEGQGRGIPAELVRGQQEKLYKQRELGRQSMGIQEANLLSRLGLAQESRKAQQEAIKTGLGFLQTDIETQQKAIDKIDEQNKDIISQAEKMTTQSRDTLKLILDNFQGIDFKDLSEQSKQTISYLAKTAGLDLGIVEAGMKAVKDKQDFDNLIKTQETQAKTTTAEAKTGTSKVNIPTNTLAYKNNNPGNLRFAGQLGATQGEGGFAKFSSPENGYQALLEQINLDKTRNLTLSQFISKYAPPNENDTTTYINQAMSALGVSSNTPISKIDTNKIAEFMAKKESGTSVETTTATKLSAGQQDDLATMKTVEDTINELSSLKDFSGTGGLYGGSVSQWLLKNLGMGKEEEENTRNKISRIQGDIAKLRGGSSFTPNEQKLLDSYTPTIDDSEVMIRSKLKELKTFIANKRANTMNIAKGNITTGTTQNSEADYINSLGL